MRKHVRKLLAAAGCMAVMLAFGVIPVQGQTTLDPSTLHIGPGAGTACATGCGGDPNNIGDGSTVDIYQNSGGASALSQPVFLILGVPNDTTNLFSSAPGTVTFINPYPGGTTTSGSAASATGGSSQWGMVGPTTNGGTAGTAFFGDMTSSDVYTFLNLPGNSSNSFTNWAGVDSSRNSITATDFGIYVFALSGAQLGAHGLVNVSGFQGGALPLGTIAIGWGCQTAGTSACSNSNSFSTPFTEAGYADAPPPPPVPEPGTMLLFGAGLLIFGQTLRRRFAGTR